MSIDIARLERDLRAAASTYDDQPVSGDAWQENQRRLAAAHRRRSPWLAAAAAVVVLLLVGAAVVLRGPQHTADGPPAGPAPRTTSPDGSIHLAGGVEAYRLTLPIGYTAVDVVASGDTAHSPARVCSMLTSEGKPGDFAAGETVCSPREPDASDPGVAVDYLTTTPTHPTANSWVTVSGAVDERVTSVQVWLADGNTGSLQVTPLGGRTGTNAFAYVNIGPDQQPLRLVAYGAGGRVLQSIDLPSRLGPQYQLRTFQCGRVGNTVPLAGLPATVSAVPGFATLTVTGAHQQTTCLPLTSEGQGARVGVRDAVLVVAPEVAYVQAQGPLGPDILVAPPVTIPDSGWKAVLVHRTRGVFSVADTFVLTDVTGQQRLGSVPFAALR